jgi:hypothetical protein
MKAKINSPLPARRPPTDKSTKVQCPVCQRRVKRSGLDKHTGELHRGVHMIDIQLVVKSKGEPL